jgi:agmatine/peptidylarginine deiminase
MDELLRFPAEWERQSAILIAWPHAGTDWAERLESVEATYVALVAAITRFQVAVICVADKGVEARARGLLTESSTTMARVRFECLPYDDTWLRDSVRSPCVTTANFAFWTFISPPGAASLRPASMTKSWSA